MCRKDLTEDGFDEADLLKQRLMCQEKLKTLKLKKEKTVIPTSINPNTSNPECKLRRSLYLYQRDIL